MLTFCPNAKLLVVEERHTFHFATFRCVFKADRNLSLWSELLMTYCSKKGFQLKC